MLRNKAGRYAYVLGLVLGCFAIAVCGMLDALGIIRHGRGLVLFLGAYVLVQYAAGILIYRRLSDKY